MICILQQSKIKNIKYYSVLLDSLHPSLYHIGLDDTEHISSIEYVLHINSHESKITFVYYYKLYE